MALKKNIVSYVAWMILLLFTGVTFAFLGMVATRITEVNIVVAALGCIVLFFGILFLIYSMSGFIISMHISEGGSPFLKKHARTIDILVVVFYIIIGFVVRICFMEFAGEEAAYYEISKVTSQSGIMVQSVQGSVYYYCLLLHGLFLLVGNHWIAGIWMQIVLQMLGTVLLYLAMKKLTTRWASLLLLAYTLFSPTSIMMSITYSPQVLFFVIFSLGLFLFAHYLFYEDRLVENSLIMWTCTIGLGFFIGFTIYMDVTGSLLLIPGIYLFMRKNTILTQKERIAQFFGIIGSAVVFFFVLLLLDSLFSKTSFTGVLHAWFVTYSSLEWNTGIITSNTTIDFLVSMVMICVGTLSFWRRKTTEYFTPFILFCLSISVFYVLGITTMNMDGSYLMQVLFAALASISITELFASEVIEKKDTEEIEVIDLEKPTEKENTIQEPVRLIESPLPGPKKHVRKNMDYALNVNEKDMKYDILVSDSDDYDV